MPIAIERVEEMRLAAPLEAEIAALIATAWDDYEGRSFYKQRHHLRLLAREEGRLLGHMALGLRAVRLGDDLVDIATLGEVCTHPEARGRGIASALLQEAIAEAKASPARFFLLFGVAKLYPAAGFRPITQNLRLLGMDGARSLRMVHSRADDLMVLELRGEAWDEDKPLDLMGGSF
ncbi:GNAT family N-acetyltransferase [Pseudoroseicyclus tamaricis]|uniref:GNAT family N-acetyltransferase n=1 Tax=Pseudoroseicyclus tamaricis TaxID=2705421 RepID=A0A6B2JLS5_9RHOB|nr:GNAT family N-acetyltransferase [Pseudoroseicyclus tamaricis]NDU99576.1 GNAT family N-acetyltransferase [Pseudoroseicyclus tamaricis]